MSPILGIWASSKPGAPATSFESIATVTVGSGGASNVEFTNIPGTYTHLQLRYATLASTDSARYFTIRFNNDTTTANYRYHYIVGNGTSASAATSQNAFEGEFYSSTNPGVGIVDILDYANTNKYKTKRSLFGNDNNGAGVLYFDSALWMSTAAITSIKLTISSNSIAQYSHFALYGIKGA